jgi:hypothetical protein
LMNYDSSYSDYCHSYKLSYRTLSDVLYELH